MNDLIFTGNYRLLGFVLCFLIPATAFLQSENHLIHGALYDSYLDYQLLPGDGIRIFILSDQNNGWNNNRMIYQDFYLDSSLAVNSPVEVFISGEYFYWLVDQANMLKLRDGAVLWANNIFDCDYGSPGGIISLEADGSIPFYLNLGEIYYGYDVSLSTFINDTTVYVGHPPDGVTLNLATGEYQHYSPQPEYSLTIQTHFGFIAAKEDQLVLLDINFNPFVSYSTEDVVTEIYPLPDSVFIISTNSQYYLLSPDTVLYELPFSAEEFKYMTASQSYYWGISLSGDVHVFDTLFSPISTYDIPYDVNLHGAIAMDSQILFYGEHTKEVLARNVILFRMNEDSVDFELPLDIGITNIVIPDTILAEYYSHTVPYQGWSFHIPIVNVEVTNFSSDTVDRFFIEGYDLLGCFWWCYYPHPLWEIDSVTIPPGESAHIQLDSFLTFCDGPELELCFTTLSPNQKADGDQSNDKYCEPFSVILGTEETREALSLNIYPNPAKDEIIISSSIVDRFEEIIIYSPTGSLIKSYKNHLAGSPLSLQELWPGTYFMKLTTGQGKVEFESLIIQR